ncbi:MAG TPA: hypothetical protein VNM68_04630 [Candidatus Polarisedimenticolia bacterium]|nr:hypothetical protein [Candidatus Polarisedimenticolia bacterium]
MSCRAIACIFACALAIAVPSVHPRGVQSDAKAHSHARDSALSRGAPEVRFAGEVIDGQPFEYDIGHGLVFRLNPLGGNAAGGWVIEILPKVQPPDGPIEFTEIATPPYHFYNQRFLAGAYGYSAREAVAITPRKFYFVQSVADERIANEVVNAVLYPGAVSDQEKDRAAGEAAVLQLGRGELRILRSRIAKGKPGEPEIIDWMKFDVVLNFSPGVTLQRLLAPKPPSTH